MTNSRFSNWLGENLLLSLLLTYLLLALSLGGSSRAAPLAHGTLQALAALGIALLAITWPRSLLLGRAKIPIALVAFMICVGLLQMVPLPAGTWELLPGRETVAEGFQSLGISSIASPVSLDVEVTAWSLGYVLPPLFTLLLSVRIGLRRLIRVVPTFLCVFSVATVLIGFVQLYGGDRNLLYFYRDTSYGFPVGFFANVNHFASFLLMVLPFVFFLFRQLGHIQENSDKRIAMTLLLASAFLILILGIGTAGSFAIYCLLLPTILLSLTGIFGGEWKFRDALKTGVVIILFVALGLFVVFESPFSDSFGVTGFGEGPTSRRRIWSYTLDAMQHYWPVGSGMGTFESVIPHFEDASSVTSVYIPMAHNEFLQILMESGVAGLLMIIISIVWILTQFFRIWFDKSNFGPDALDKMAMIGVVVCLLHSSVDYPARTPAIGTILGLYISIICLPREKTPVRRTKQVSDNEKRLVL